MLYSTLLVIAATLLEGKPITAHSYSISFLPPVESRKCFSCLDADYSGPTAALLSLDLCGDFNPENDLIVRECLGTEKCYIASLDETL